MTTAPIRAVLGPILLLAALTASSCPMAPRGIARFMVATIDDFAWTADGYTDAGLVHPFAEYGLGDSTLFLFGVGEATTGIRWTVQIRVRARLGDTATFVLGDSGTAGDAVLGEDVRDGADTVYRTTASAPGTLTITSFDTSANIVTGKFAFSATDPDARRTVSVTGGSFVLFCHVTDLPVANRAK